MILFFSMLVPNVTLQTIVECIYIRKAVFPYQFSELNWRMSKPFDLSQYSITVSVDENPSFEVEEIDSATGSEEEGELFGEINVD